MKITRIFLVAAALLFCSSSRAMTFKEGDQVYLVGGPYGPDKPVKAKIGSAFQGLAGDKSLEQLKMLPVVSSYLAAHGHDVKLLDSKAIYCVVIARAYHLVHASWIKPLGTVASAATPAQKVASKK